jgi:hypothetical protein
MKEIAECKRCRIERPYTLIAITSFCTCMGCLIQSCARIRNWKREVPQFGSATGDGLIYSDYFPYQSSRSRSFVKIQCIRDHRTHGNSERLECDSLTAG